jgi:SAM-dependent methyltransferase
LVAQPNFNAIARPYRWLEYLTLGRALERAREHFLPHLQSSNRALILGDGDGRFTARLLAFNPSIEIEAVDISAAMLTLLRRRAGPHQGRLTTHHTSAHTYIPTSPPDLIVTHFFLDCLTQPELDTLAIRLAAALPPHGQWLLSDFRIPPGLMRLPAQLLVRALYLGFRILTGLRVRQLPDHTSALQQAGLTRVAHHHALFGLLTSELWQKPS